MSDPAVGVGIDLLAVDTVVHSEVGTCDSLSVNFKVDGAVGTDENVAHSRDHKRRLGSMQRWISHSRALDQSCGG